MIQKEGGSWWWVKGASVESLITVSYFNFCFLNQQAHLCSSLNKSVVLLFKYVHWLCVHLHIFQLKVYFYLKGRITEKGREIESSICWFIPQMAQCLGLSQAKDKNLELHLDLSGVQQGPKHLSCIPLLFQAHSQGAGSAVEQQELKPTFMWSAGITGDDLTDTACPTICLSTFTHFWKLCL